MATETEEQNLETSPEESSSPETPPTPNPTGTPIRSEADDSERAKEKRIMAALEATLRDQNRIIDEQNARLATITVAPPATRDPEEERQRFYQDPAGVVRDEIERSVAPLRDFIKELKAGDKKGDLIKQAKADVRFTHLFGIPGFEPAVADLVNNLTAEQLTLPNVLSIVVQVTGLAGAGLLEGVSLNGNTTSTPTPTPTREERAVTIPPHVRPSGSPAPSGPAGKKLRTLNENEERLRREKGQTHEEFLEWLEVPAQGVATSDIGREAKK